MSTEEKIALSDEAKKLLDNPILQMAFQKVRDRAIMELTESKHDQSEYRESLYHRLSALSEVKQALEFMIRDGVIARAKLQKPSVPTLKSLDR